MIALKTLLFTLLVPGTVAGIVPYLLQASSDNAFGPGRWAGLALLIPGILIYATCAWDFTVSGQGTPSPNDPPRLLVKNGLYRLSRNPMYVGVVAVLLGEGIVYGSWRVLLYGVVVACAFHVRVVYYEEPVLRASFGDAYAEYCAVVPRWFLGL